MEQSFEPNRRRKFSVEQYVDEFGPKLDATGQERNRPTMICLACGSMMHTIGENGPLRDATWGHNPSKGNGPWCPLKEKNGAKYEMLAPVDPDREAGKALRHDFFANWQIYWGFICQLAPMADIHTLVGFLKHADVIRLWEQRNLRQWHLPYIFLSMCEFPPPVSRKAASIRSRWLRFRFDARVRTLEDLWIRTDGDWAFLKTSYRVPSRAASPGPKHLIDVELITPDPGFLTQKFQEPNTYQTDVMVKNFPNDLI